MAPREQERPLSEHQRRAGDLLDETVVVLDDGAGGTSGTAPIRLVVLADDPVLAARVAASLRSTAGDAVAAGWVIRVADLVAAFLAAERAPDVVVLATSLPAGPATEQLEAVLASLPHATVVVARPRNDDAAATTLIAAGAQDAVVLGDLADTHVLVSAARRAHARAHRTTAIRAAATELGAFAHTVAHDLRSPLAVVAATASLLASDGERLGSAARRDLAGRIHGAATNLSSMVTGLLAFAEEAGSRRAPVELETVVARTRRVVAHELDAAGGELVVRRPLPRVLGDEAAVGSVLLNLVGNAIRYRAPQRPLRIEIAAEQLGGVVVVTVGDNGRGVAPTERARMFAFGHRGRAAADGEVEGAGVGLSTVRRIVAQLGGAVWATDGPGGVGTRMRFSLPAPPSTARSDAPRA